MYETSLAGSNFENAQDPADSKEGWLRILYLRGAPNGHHRRLVPDF